MRAITKTNIGFFLALVAVLGAGIWSRYRPLDGTKKPQAQMGLTHEVSTEVDVPPQAKSSIRVETHTFSSATLSHDVIYQVVEQFKMGEKSLSKEECRILFEFLAAPYPEIPPHRLAGIQNEVLHILRGQPNLPAPWDQMLASLFLDRGLSSTIRDYALQHLFTWYEEVRDGSRNGEREEALKRMPEVFWHALKETDSEIAGTALLGTCYLAEQEMDFDRRRVGIEALALTRNARANAQSRLTALQVCSRLGLKEAVPTALELARGAETLPLRCSAIAALGALGGGTELTILRSMIQEKRVGMESAISRAIQQLTISEKGLPL